MYLFIVKSVHADILHTVYPVPIQDPASPFVYCQMFHSWLISYLPGKWNNVVSTNNRVF